VRLFISVTEADLKSGALITLDYATEQNRRTYIVPSNIDSGEEKVVMELQKSEMHFDELLIVTNLDVTALNSLLCKMEISEIIKKLSGIFIFYETYHCRVAE